MTDSQAASLKKRLLFFSLDGVVHPQPEGSLPRSWDTGVLPLLGIRFFLARPMRRIITLCEELDIGIVLTSSWRLAGFSQQELNQVFKGLVVGLTPDLSGKNYQGPLREREILAYLEAHGEGLSFAIVDSSPDNFSTAELDLHIAAPKSMFSDELSAQINHNLNRV
jgi:hypothetical protein